MSGILLEKGGGVISASVVPHVRNTSGKCGGGGGFLRPWYPMSEILLENGEDVNFSVRGAPCLEYFSKMGGGGVISASVVPHVGSDCEKSHALRVVSVSTS